MTASSRLRENARTGERYPAHRSHLFGTFDPCQRLAVLYFRSPTEDRILDHSARVKHASRASVVHNGRRTHAARLVHPHSAEKADKTLILLHGYPADKGNILPALAFLHADFNLLLFDFRYLGESEGSYSTAGAKEVEDFLAAIRFLKRRGIKEVGVWGFSMGGAVGLMAIDKAPEIKAVVSESSYASLAEMALQLFRMPLLNYPMAYLIGFWANLFLGIDVRDVSPAESIRNTTAAHSHHSFVHRCGGPIFPSQDVAASAGQQSTR